MLVPKQREQGTWSWQLPDETRGPARDHPDAEPPSTGFRRAVAYTIAGTAIPGLGLIAGRRRIIGHGLEDGGTWYCCAHCARKAGARALVDRT